VNFLKNFLLLLFFLLGTSIFANENGKDITSISSGYIQIDNISWSGDKNDDFLSGAFLKNANFSINGKYDKKFSYYINLDYKLKQKIAQAYIQYSSNSWNIKFGKMLIPFSLEESINSNHRVFMERCLLEGIIENNFLGFALNFKKNFYNASISLIVPELVYNFDKKQNNKYSIFLRSFINPISYLNFFGHIGVSYKLIKTHPEEQSPLGSIMFKDIPSFYALNSLLVSQLSSLPKYYVLGFELIGVWSSLCVQSEISYINALWRDYESEIYNSWYIQASLLLTGETRSYNFNLGNLSDPIPRFAFGAFEIAFRYSHNYMINNGPLLRGVSAKDGKKDSFVFGLNWFINSGLKLQINYAYEEFTYRLLNNRSLSGIGFRMQFSF